MKKKMLKLYFYITMKNYRYITNLIIVCYFFLIFVSVKKKNN